MDGKKLQVESCFVGAAVLTGAKVVKGVSKAKKDFDFKAAGNTPPLNLEKKTTVKKPTPETKQNEQIVYILFVGILVLAAFYVGKKTN